MLPTGLYSVLLLTCIGQIKCGFQRPEDFAKCDIRPIEIYPGEDADLDVGTLFEYFCSLKNINDDGDKRLDCEIKLTEPITKETKVSLKVDQWMNGAWDRGIYDGTGLLFDYIDRFCSRAWENIRKEVVPPVEEVDFFPAGSYSLKDFGASPNDFDIPVSAYGKFRATAKLFNADEELLISLMMEFDDAGVGYINEGDIALLFYITLENRCAKDFDIFATMIQCCENSKPQESGCNSMYLIGGYMGLLSSKSIRNITLIYPNLYLYNRGGLCTVNVKYRNANVDKQVTAEVDFKTPATKCPDLGICATADLDPLQNCSPMDCVIKYSGEISYFNHRSKECQNVPMCLSDPEKYTPDIAYSIANNNCSQLNSAITKIDLQILETVLEETSSQGTEDDSSFQMNFVCHHGTLDNGQCICESDWVTTTDAELYQPTLLQYHMCNVEVGAWNCVNKGKIRTTALLITIFAVTIASKILILMCILNWCYKHFKSKKKVCTAQKSESFDASIIICDAEESYERCICTEELIDSLEEVPLKKRSALKSETVNVSYYPCVPPSRFSSLNASTKSVKCKTSLKVSDPTVILSNTSTSSAPASFETDTDDSTDDSEEDEDLNYDIEFLEEAEEEEDEDEDEEVEDEEAEDEESKIFYQQMKTNKNMVHISSSVVLGEDDSEYSVSVLEEAARKRSSSSKSRTASEVTVSSKKSTY